MIGSWSSGGNLSTARYGLGGAGTQAAGLSFGGKSTSDLATTEEYNGTSWSSGGNLATARSFMIGCGTQTAGLSVSGYTTVNLAVTEEYNGTSWSSGGNVSVARRSLGGAGTQTSGLCFGGLTSVEVNTTEEYNGTAWSSGGNLNTAKRGTAGCGTQTAGLCSSGHDGSNYISTTEEYNGISWSSGNNTTMARGYAVGSGTQTAGLSFGGTTLSIYVDTTERYNGTSWVLSNDLATARYLLAGCGTESASLSFGGYAGSSSLTVTEEYTISEPDTGPSVWSLGGNLATARSHLGGCGTQTAGLSFGGYTTVNLAVTEEYNGTSWSSGGNLSTARRILAGAGTQTAGLSFGGHIAAVTAITEEYNGISWSSGGNLSTARYGLAGCGTQTAGLSFGGYTTVRSNITEEYNGTSWSSGGNLSTARSSLAGAGSQTAGLSFGGYTTTIYVANTEEYNGTSWSSGGDLSTARSGLAGCGTQIAGLSFGGWEGTTNFSVTEEYNGAAWSAGGSLITARRLLAGTGSQTAGLSFGGIPGTGVSAATEEYTVSEPGPDPGVWSLGGNLATGRDNLGGAGSQTAGLSFGGFTTNIYVANTEEYNGVSWSSGGNLATARHYLAGCGTQTAGLSFGGYTTARLAITEEYNGTSWSSGGNLATGQYEFAGAGTQTAGLSFGGNSTSAVTEEYNGTSWSSGGNLATGRRCLAGCGTQTAGLSFGGYATSAEAATEEYNGTSWSSGGSLAYARSNLGGCGTQIAGLSFGGYTMYTVGATEEYNGTSWSAGDNLITYRSGLAGAGSQTAGLSFGGGAYGSLTATEEYTISEAGPDPDPGPSVWSLGGDLATARSHLGGCGTQTAGLSFSGYIATYVSTTEEYNGVGWSSGGNLSIAKYLLAGAGTQSAGLAFGGFTTVNIAATEEYNGTSWSSGGNLISARRGLAGCGTQGASLSFGGYLTSPTGLTEEYDGTVWSSGGSLSTARYCFGGAGTQAAGLSFGGCTGSSTYLSSTEEYNGTSWGSGGNLSVIRGYLAGCGTQTAGLSFGGKTTVDSVLTEEYNGTAWSAGGSLITARYLLAGAGSQTAGLSFGGISGTGVSATEEYLPYVFEKSWLSNWAKRIKLTVDHTKVDSDQIHFPVTVFLSSTHGDAVFEELGSDGNRKKIAVTRVDGVTEIYGEIEKWNDANESAIIHVSESGWCLSSSEDTDFYLYYDVTKLENTAFIGDIGSAPGEKVWDSNFKMIQHMVDASTSTIVDSTSDSNDGTKVAANEPIEATSKVGQGQDFDGTNDYINCGSATDLDNLAQKTVEAIVKLDTYGELEYGRIAQKALENAGWSFLVHTSHCLVYSHHWADVVNWRTPDDSLLLSTYYHTAVTYDKGSTANNPKIYINSALKSLTENTPPTGSSVDESSRDLWIGARKTASGTDREFNGIIDEVRISNSIRSAAWIKATYNSLWDALLTFSGEESFSGRISVGGDFELLYGDISTAFEGFELLYGNVPFICEDFELLYGNVPFICEDFELIYSFPISSDIIEPYDIPIGDFPHKYVIEYYRDRTAPQIDVVEWFGNRNIPYHSNSFLYGNVIPINVGTEEYYTLLSQPIIAVETPFTICDSVVLSDFEEVYNLNTLDPAYSETTEFYSLLSGATEVKTYDIAVDVDGYTIDPYALSIHGDVNSYCLSLAMDVNSVSEYKICSYGKIATVTIDTEVFKFFLEGKSRSREHGSTKYSVTGMSPICQLDRPKAQTLLRTWDTLTTAKEIVEELADGFIDSGTHPNWWEGVNWGIPANTLFANDESPLDVIRKLVRVSGGIIQAYPDGTLRIRKRYPYPVPDWNTASADFTLSDEADFFAVSESFDLRDGYNKVLVSNQDISDSDRVTIHEVSVDSQTKRLRCFHTPYSGDFELKTSGGIWVTIELIGTTEETITEVVEIVEGSGSVSRPIYSEDTTQRAYLQTQLGAVTFAEGGNLTTEVAGQSLLRITYTTKYKEYIVRSPNIEQVQFYTETIN